MKSLSTQFTWSLIISEIGLPLWEEPIMEMNRPQDDLTVNPGTGDWPALIKAASESDGYDFEAWRRQRDADREHYRQESDSELVHPKAWPDGFFDRIAIDDPAFVRPDQGSLPPVS